MHTLGKVMLGLVIVLAIAAVLLMAKAISVRDGWTRSVAELRGQNEQQAEQIDTLSVKLQGLEGEFYRTTLGWEQYWNTQQSGVFRGPTGEPQVQAGFGAANGLIVPQGAERPTVHAFRPLPSGEFIYVGPFRVETVQAQASLLTPAWTPRPGEFQRLSQGPQNWRFRKMVPPQHASRFQGLQRQLAVADNVLAEEQLHVTQQTELVQKGTELLGQREGELTGDADAREVPGSPEYTEGLVKTLTDVEEERNREVGRLDQLRRELKRANDEANALIRRNQELVGGLPQSSAPPPIPLTSN